MFWIISSIFCLLYCTLKKETKQNKQTNKKNQPPPLHDVFLFKVSAAIQMANQFFRASEIIWEHLIFVWRLSGTILQYWCTHSLEAGFG